MHPAGKVLLALTVLCFCGGLMIFSYYYLKFARLVDEKLAGGPFTNTSRLFAAPDAVNIGDEGDPEEIAAQLRRAGYGENRSNRMGFYNLRGRSIEIFPGPDSYFQEEAGLIRFEKNRVSQIISLRDNTERSAYLLEPALITNLFDRKREKRRLVKFAEIPKVMVEAVLSAEDKRFFQHAGFDPFRVLKAAYVDVKAGGNVQGASTLSMQLARSLWLTTERNWRRKAPEILMTLHLERKLSKEEIFEHYANQIYIGHVGSFGVHGFGEGAQVYFGKDLKQLTLPEAALLAGIIQSPSRYNPFRNPDRARARRNIILRMMRENGYIMDRQYGQAIQSPLGVMASPALSDDAPFFVDLVNEKLLEKFQDHDFQANSYAVYTTLDLNLQRAAAESVAEGLKEVDELMARRGRTKAKGWPEVQAALVALDARTGEVKALVGGRDYGTSQLNRALAKRPPGSVFKPFVYAAVLREGIETGGKPILTTTTVIDEPTTFWFDEKPYEPNNFGGDFFGTVTLRQALLKSLNVPTVKFAEMVGYDRVADLAHAAGMNKQIVATPAIALGAYEVMPIEIAGAYTIFSNRGVAVEPSYIRVIRDQNGKPIFTAKPRSAEVLDPRISYMLVHLMEDVLRSGTGAGARARGFVLPAAGKTGTSHDAWFAGFTTELLCVVWVGYDDNRDIKTEGAKAALPIWTAFMKKAHQFRPYRRARAFEPSDGVVILEVDQASGRLAAGPGCSGKTKAEVFVAGTQPLETCSGSAVTQVASWDAPAHAAPSEAAQVAEVREPARETPGKRASGNAEITTPAQTPDTNQKPKKKGFFGRIADIFR